MQKAMGTCFGNANVIYKFETDENATGTHLLKRILSRILLDWLLICCITFQKLNALEAQNLSF